MNKYTKIAITIFSISMSACALAPSANTPMTKIGNDYETNGNATGVHPFIYGNRTLIELKEAPIWLSIPFWLKVHDENGNLVNYKRDGNYYTLEQKLDHFTVSTGTRSVTFNLAASEEPLAEPRNLPKELSEVTSDVSNKSETALSARSSKLDINTNLQFEPVFSIMKEQLKQYRQLLQQSEVKRNATDKELQALHNKLDSLDKKMTDGIAIVHVYFNRNSIKFEPDEDVLNALLSAARIAKQIKIDGRTNAAIDDKQSMAIAIQRAKNTKRFLVEHGVDEAKIHTSSLGSGDSITARHSKEGTLFNNRVAIAIIND